LLRLDYLISDLTAVYIVPRWGGGVIIMSTIGETRVLLENLPDLYERLAKAFQSAI
jgi:hypothetical protein